MTQEVTLSENTATETTTTVGPGEDNQTPQEGAGTAAKDTKPEMSREDYEAALRDARKDAARYRSERNEFRADAEKYREQQDAEKSELQRAQEAQTKLQHDYEALQAQNQRLVIVSKYGIAEENIDLLGDDPEKFEANAKRIAELQANTARKSGPPSDVPVENLHSGASAPKDTPDNSYPADWPVTGPFAAK